MLASNEGGVPVVREPMTLTRRIVIASGVFLLIGALIFAAAGGGEQGRVAGAGSTFAAPIIERASTAYQSYLAADRVDVTAQAGTSVDWVGAATAIDYDPVGSVGGLVRLSDPKISFAATEVPLSAEGLAERGMVQFPIILGAVAPVVNLDLGGASLTLDAATLGAIFSGAVTDWSDPAITALNEGLALPAGPIAVVHRSDGSGTTHTFTGFLAAGGAWAPGQSAQPDWPAGTGAEGSRGVIAAVRDTPGAIGYVEVGQARRAGLSPVRLLNASGQAVEPNAPGIRAAAAGADWTGPGGGAVNLGATPAATAWPMVAVVYAVVPREGAGRDVTRTLAYFDFFYAEAARSADALGYVALPPEAVEAVQAMWTETFQFEKFEFRS
jgi:phosphate transport system substrate-binding protein